MTELAHTLNHLGQPIGQPVPNWTPPKPPSQAPMVGMYCRLERLEPQTHAKELFEAGQLDTEGKNWTYLFEGPFEEYDEYLEWLIQKSQLADPLFFAIIDLSTNRAVGVASYLRIDTTHGVIEVGNINFSPLLQRTRAATEAMYLMMERAFEQGYRRYEWKCDSLNAPSRRAAQRFGLSYEGIFRQAIVVKGRNRDTAWYAAIDGEWPQLQAAFNTWLAPENFDEACQQKVSLSSLTAPILKAQG